jgi:sugar/nucleoside kinase (ribokinase family)
MIIMLYLRNCQEITFYSACLFLREHHSKISYIASYAPDFKGEVEKQIQNAQFFLQGILEYVDSVFSGKENGTSD